MNWMLVMDASEELTQQLTKNWTWLGLSSQVEQT